MNIQRMREYDQYIYGTNYHNWICSYWYYQEKPYKLCKHLVAWCERADNMEYPLPSPWNPQAFSTLPPFLRFDLLPIRDQNTDLQHDDHNAEQQIRAVSQANDNVIATLPQQAIIPPDNLTPKEQAEQAEMISPMIITVLREFLE